MPPRPWPALAAMMTLVVVAACATPVVVSTPVPSFVPPIQVQVAHAPDPTPVPLVPGFVASGLMTPEPVVTDPSNPEPVTSDPEIPPRSTPPVTGGVNGALDRPELTIERVGAETVQATILDPDAKAWRLVIAGSGEFGGERWEIAVETGDVGPVITATEVRGGREVDVMDLTGFADGTAAAGGCHSVLPVCLGSDGFRLPSDGDGRFSLRLELPQSPMPLVIRGGTARWDGEPFVLGPWHDTQVFQWGEG